MSLKKSGEDSDSITLKPGSNVLKFSLNNFLEIQLTDTEKQSTADGNFLSTTWTQDAGNDLCTCDNYILEAHYKVQFSQGSAPNQYSIDNLTTDLVYGKLQ